MKRVKFSEIIGCFAIAKEDSKKIFFSQSETDKYSEIPHFVAIEPRENWLTFKWLEKKEDSWENSLSCIKYLFFSCLTVFTISDLTRFTAEYRKWLLHCWIPEKSASWESSWGWKYKWKTLAVIRKFNFLIFCQFFFVWY